MKANKQKNDSYSPNTDITISPVEMSLQGMFGLEFFLVLEALLFLFTCYQVVKAGRILDEIQDKPHFHHL